MVLDGSVTPKFPPTNGNLLDDPFSRKGGIFLPVFRLGIGVYEQFSDMGRVDGKTPFRARDLTGITENPELWLLPFGSRGTHSQPQAWRSQVFYATKYTRWSIIETVLPPVAWEDVEPL